MIAIKVQISSSMVSWLQGFCDKSDGQKDERDGLEILSDIMNSQIFNYLKAKRALIHLGTDSIISDRSSIIPLKRDLYCNNDHLKS